jgi:hypothetical protein
MGYMYVIQYIRIFIQIPNIHDGHSNLEGWQILNIHDGHPNPKGWFHKMEIYGNILNIYGNIFKIY